MYPTINDWARQSGEFAELMRLFYPTNLYPRKRHPYNLPMKLLNDLNLSQSSLQDFEQCPRRFRLRYIERQRWPAIESEPVAEAERLARLGADFHRLVHQHLIGLDLDLLSESLAEQSADLRRWWSSYLAQRPPQLAEAVALYPELKLSTSLRGYLLMARFDALAQMADGTFLIIDWKTTDNKPVREVLERRMQTRIYPYVLTQAGAAFNGGSAIAPEAVSMLYWYPEFPAEPELFTYSQQLFQHDDLTLSDLVDRIEHAAERDDFPQTEETQRCRFCVYRSWCERGQAAGALPEAIDISLAVNGDVLCINVGSGAIFFRLTEPAKRSISKPLKNINPS